MIDRELDRRIGVVGAGTIGSGIARLLADLDAAVVVVAPRPGGVERAADALRQSYGSDVERGRLGPAEADVRLCNIHFTPSYSDLAGVECVIESVVEDVQTKREVLTAIEDVVAPDCIIATNTASIPIARIAAAAIRRDRVIGTRYFWPAHRYRLIEIACSRATSARTLHRTLDLALWQGKVPLIVRDSPGFFTARVLLVYLNEAIALVAEGASIDAVDRAMTDFGWPMGPFRLMDAVGVEILRGVHDSVSRHLGARVAHVPRLWPLLRAGHLGHGCRRAGAKGFYRDPDGRVVDERIYPLIPRDAKKAPSPVDIATRPIWQMINEIGHCLAERIVSSPGDADLGAILGLGWPQWQGGPIEFARRVGLDHIGGDLRRWTEQHGSRFVPGDFLLQSISIGAGRRRPLLVV
jgi:3-hydroxyacyl-CoA dehydrogenase / enoyl-CoA hydratase / 3-hydroxybutyryl-CoA epimerase